jgi:DNA-binding response OmpR family regulator
MRWRILVIDDDLAVRETLAQVLSERSYDVVLAPTGAHGLALFNAAPTDLVITDIVMPVMEGLQTLREFRRGRPALPIIAISGGSHAGRNAFLDIARQLGAWEVLMKPFDPDELVARVESCLSPRPVSR